MPHGFKVLGQFLEDAVGRTTVPKSASGTFLRLLSLHIPFGLPSEDAFQASDDEPWDLVDIQVKMLNDRRNLMKEFLSILDQIAITEKDVEGDTIASFAPKAGRQIIQIQFPGPAHRYHRRRQGSHSDCHLYSLSDMRDFIAPPSPSHI